MKIQDMSTNLKSINKMISASKRLRMANILYKEECKDHKAFLKKYIKKSKHLLKKSQSGQSKKKELSYD